MLLSQEVFRMDMGPFPVTIILFSSMPLKVSISPIEQPSERLSMSRSLETFLEMMLALALMIDTQTGRLHPDDHQ